MKIIFLGTNGWYDTATGNTICILIRANEFDIVLDAGIGLHKLDNYIVNQDEKPVYLFLSHLHLDHVYGLHTLVKFHFSRGMTICIPPGTKSALNLLVNEPYTVPLAGLPYPVKILELPEEGGRLPFKTEAKALVHKSVTFGYRIAADGFIVSYCPDTGYCANAVSLSRQADLAITECAYKSGQSNESWPHLNPEEAARIAKEAKAARLAMVHFAASTHPALSDRRESENAARRVFPNTIAALDGM
ncbi:MAG TPA: ribonuclease Z, partial [Smithellaceae bacterium]|nr:ribonuclease Z [Smithellaceae bacterium]